MILAKIDWSMSRLLGLGWTQFWQLTLVAVTAGVIARLLLRHRPHLAYLLWMLVIIKAITPPVVSSPTGLFSWAMRERPAPVVSAPVSQQTQTALPETPQSASALDPMRALAPEDLERQAGVQRPPAKAPSEPWRLDSLLAIVWITGTMAVALLVAAKWITFRRRWRAGIAAVPMELREQIDELAQRLGLRPGVRRRLRVLVSQAADSPAVFGVWCPTLLLPARQLPANSLRSPAGDNTQCTGNASLLAIIAHELVHIRRCDTMAALVQLVAQAVWWFHPLVWWANREVRRERERSCDEETVLGLGCSPHAYARVLLAILEAQRRPIGVVTVPAVGMLGVTAARMEHLLRGSSKFHRRTPRPFFAVAIVALLALLPGAGLKSAARESAPPPDAADTVPASDVVVEFRLNSAAEATTQPAESAPSKAAAALRERAKLAFEIGCDFDAFAVAVDKEERFLVVAGNLSPPSFVGTKAFEDWVSGKGRGVIDLWDLQNRKKLRRFAGDYGAVFGAAFSPEARLLATTGRQFNDAHRGNVLLWDLKTAKPLDSLKYVPTPEKLGTQMWQLTTAFSADGSLLAAGGFDRSPVVWAMPGATQIERLPRQSSFCDRLLFTPDGSRLIVPTRRGDVTIWDTKTWKLVRELKVKQLFLLGAALSPDGQTLAVGGAITSPEPSKQLQKKSEPGGKEKEKDERPTQKGHVTVWDVASGRIRAEFELGDYQVVSGLSFSPDSRLLAAAGLYPDVTIWDWAKQEVHALIAQPHASSGDRVEFLPRSGRLMLESHGRPIKFYDLR